MIVVYLGDDGLLQLPSEVMQQMQVQCGDSVEMITRDETLILRSVREQ